MSSVRGSKLRARVCEEQTGRPSVLRDQRDSDSDSGATVRAVIQSEKHGSTLQLFHSDCPSACVRESRVSGLSTALVQPSVLPCCEQTQKAIRALSQPRGQSVSIWKSTDDEPWCL